MKERPLWAVLLLFFAATCFLIPTSAHAQAMGEIVGTVTDPSGAVVPSAKVSVTQEGTGRTRSATANGEGYFVLPSLHPAQYDLSVKASGFRTYVQKGITLQANQTATVNVKLQVGQATQSVTVSGAAPLINTSNGTVSEVVDQRRMVDLPLNGRNAADLSLLVAGAVSAPANGANQGSTKTFPGAVTISTNGSRQNTVSYTLDGANHNDEYTNVNSPFPFPDALQEFSVQTSNYSAKFGGTSGGVVNIVTKSGTNKLHGDGFEFVRNAVFNARNFFETNRDQLKRNQFGGTIGGPVDIPGIYNGHNKTFFFFGYQGTRIRNVSGGHHAYVPTAAELNGNFSAYLSATNPANAIGQAVTITNPCPSVPELAPNQFNLSQCPLDPVAVSIAQHLPNATGSGEIFYTQPGEHQDYNQFVTRGDQTLSDKDQLSLMYYYNRFSSAGYYDPKNFLSMSTFSRIVYHNAMIHETHTFRPNLLNDFRVSYSRTASVRGPVPGTPGLGDLGAQIYQPSPVAPHMSVSGFFSYGTSDAAKFIRNDYTWADSLSWIKGKNNFAFGGSFDRSMVDIRNFFLSSGNPSFSGDELGVAIADFLFGRMHNFRQGYGEYKENRNIFIGLYAQDQLRATRRLTLDLGIRYAPSWPWREKQGRFEQFNPAWVYNGPASQIFTNAPKGLLFPGDPGVPSRGTTGVFTNFGPRFGFAYDLTGNGTTTIRGGAGMFYNSRTDGIINNRFSDISPFSPQVNLTSPVGSLTNPYAGGVIDPFPFTYPPTSNFVFPEPILGNTFDPSQPWVSPVSYNYNLQIAHQFRDNWMMRVGYVGSRGNHLMETIEMDPAVYVPGSSLSTDQRRYFNYYNPVNINNANPTAIFSTIGQASHDINSLYNSLQVTAQKRFSSSGPKLLRNVTILASYTYSKSLDDAPWGQDITTVVSGSDSTIPWYMPYRHQMDHGPSQFNHTNRFVASYVWQLPGLSNYNSFVHQVLGGWALTGIFTAQSGDSLTIFAGKDISGTDIGRDRAVVLGPAVGGTACAGNTSTCVNYLNPNSFGYPAAGSFGNAGKGAFTGPGQVTWDMGFFKNIPLRGSERYRVQFRAEFFNIFNRVNFNDPNSTVNSGGFGSITGAGDPRIGQLALKVFF